MFEIVQVDTEVIEQNNIQNGVHICKYYFIEEAAELTKELTKSIRGKENKEELVKEIADVYYTLSMLVQEYSISAEEINASIKFKENRAKQALGITPTN